MAPSTERTETENKQKDNKYIRMKQELKRISMTITLEEIEGREKQKIMWRMASDDLKDMLLEHETADEEEI